MLEIADLEVAFETRMGHVKVVSDFSLSVARGECVGIVGESGAGKTQALLAVMGLLPRGARVSGSARLQGEELLGRGAGALDEFRGARIAMIFQDPLTALTPHMRVGDQIAEVLVRHRRLSWSAGRERALELLRAVHIADAERRLRQYPHELSGGMRQRVMIAMALACEPDVLIADEPTTALDVTVQAQILALLAELKRTRGMSLVLVTHDLGVIAGLADRVAVMYAGRLVEQGTARAVLKAPRHPYTRALLDSMPRLDVPSSEPLRAIRGQPPDPRALPAGCAFHPRCDLAADLCRSARPRLRPTGDGMVACHRPLGAAAGEEGPTS